MKGTKSTNLSKWRFGVVGAGGIVQGVHLPALKNIEHGELVAIADPRVDVAQKVADTFGIKQVFKDYTEMIEKCPEINVVDVCSPNAFHYPIAVKALNAGMHVICEKPLAITVKQVETMITVAKKNNRKLMSIQNHRFSSHAMKMKEIVTTGTLGEIYYVRARALRRRGVPCTPTFIKKEWSGGGPMFDIGVHILDLAYWLLSSPKVKSVSGTTVKKLVDCEGMFSLWGDLAQHRKMYDVEDFAVGLVKFKDGKTLLLEASFLLNMKENEVVDLDMFGTKAGAYLSLFGQIELHRVNDKNVFSIDQVGNLPGTSPHSDQIRAFLSAVDKNKPVPVPPEETLEVIKILEGVYRSSLTGKEVTFG